MLLSSARIINCPVLSVQIGGAIANTVAPIIDPEHLRIIAFTVSGPETGNGEHGDILDLRSVREFSHLGMIVDSIDELVSSGDVVKLDRIMSLDFNLIGLSVETKRGTKLGKIIDYTVDSASFLIQQLIVKRPLIKSFLDPELVINRNQIIEINDYKIIVKDEHSAAKPTRTSAHSTDFAPNFVNPFRSVPEPTPAPSPDT